MRNVLDRCSLRIRLIGIVFCCVGFFSCSSSSDTIKRLPVNDNLYVVDLDQAGKTESLLYSSLYSAVKTIILDTTQDILIGMVNKIDVHQGVIFVLDNMQSKAVFMFAFDGTFIRQLGGRGSGPGEYLDVADFTIDSANGVVYLLDNQRQRINAYDIATGKYLRKVDINQENGVLSYHIHCVGGAMYADAYFSVPSPQNYLLQKIDLSSGKQQAVFLSVGEYNKGWSDMNIIDNQVFCSLTSDSALFMHRFMDEVILLEEQEVTPYLVLKGKHMMSSQDVKTMDQTQDYISILMELRAKNRVYNIESCVKHRDSIFIECQQGGKFLSVLYDIKNGETKYLYFKDDLLFSPQREVGGFLPSFGCATSEGQFYFVNTSNLADLKVSAGNGRLSPDLDQLDRLKTLNDNANPVIFFYEYKR